MALCEACGQEMNMARSCEVTTIEIEGRGYDLIPYGHETRFGRCPTARRPRCHDCGVLEGGFHHPGCDVAECPRCHGQLLTCECLEQSDGESDEPRYFDAVQHPVSSRWAVFEDDGITGFLYLTPPDEQRPIADCWLYNRIEPPPDEEAQSYAESGTPPPATISYAGPHARYAPSAPPHVHFIWSRDGESVAVAVDGEVLGFITLVGRRAQSYSRKLARDGGGGNTWDEHLFHSLFGEGSR